MKKLTLSIIVIGLLTAMGVSCSKGQQKDSDYEDASQESYEEPDEEWDETLEGDETELDSLKESSLEEEDEI